MLKVDFAVLGRSVLCETAGGGCSLRLKCVDEKVGGVNERSSSDAAAGGDMLGLAPCASLVMQEEEQQRETQMVCWRFPSAKFEDA